MRIRIDIETAERMSARNRGIGCGIQNAAGLLDNIGRTRTGSRTQDAAESQQGAVCECSGIKTLNTAFTHLCRQTDAVILDKLMPVGKNLCILCCARNFLGAAINNRGISPSVKNDILSGSLHDQRIVSMAIGTDSLNTIPRNNRIIGNARADDILRSFFDPSAINASSRNILTPAIHHNIISLTTGYRLNTTFDQGIIGYYVVAT
ncbi:hypothetical protein ACIQUS_26360 [Pseudomonas sp. NPDC090755]|uniref:hypothetical protein n=1 Tax=Pseudomonas sp. NPDC090755 TaxID=3364481 RepID=UPI00383ACE8A